MSTPSGGMLPVTVPVVKALLDSASDKGRISRGVLGIRAKPTWTGPTELQHAGLHVTVAPCSSALAVREALLRRDHDSWLVILTDRDESDLGSGILAHVHRRQLRTPNPWDAVREQFAATRLDHRLAAMPRDVATGLLAARRDRPWMPARGGLLTLEHAFTAVASTWFQLPSTVDAIDIESVLAWSTRAADVSQVAELRAIANDALADAVLEWLAQRCGTAATLVQQLIRGGRVADLVALGLAARAVMATPDGSEPWIRLQVQHLDNAAPSKPALRALVTAAETVTRQALLSEAQGNLTAGQTARILTRADALVTELNAAAGLDDSELLRGSLTTRLGAVGDLLRRCVAHAAVRADNDGPGAALADPGLLGDVELAFQKVQEHVLARHRDERRVERAQAGVRLVRWLARDAKDADAPDVAAAYRRHRDQGCWVDRAYADAWNGVADETLAHGLRAVLAAVRLRRDLHDRQFAEALAAHTAHAEDLPDWLLPIEEVIAEVVVPIAKRQPVLVVVADGMSAAIATEIVQDLQGRAHPWFECLPTADSQRRAAITALPSLTEVSRCSLLSGTLATGGQNAEQNGFSALMRAHGLTGKLLHKLSLDTSGAGHDLAPEVAHAVEDTAGIQVVTCVLNTIDDALDRSDPGGTEWTGDTVKHLLPLLERARRAHRVVVLTSDHGHVIERREARMEPAEAISSNRSRPFAGGRPPGDGEVRVTGPRVLKHDGDAILTWDERLRYGPLKAGYHGGAAPSEVVVPVHVLAQDPPGGWDLAPPLHPDWWAGPVSSIEEPPVTSTVAFPPTTPETPTLFDEVVEETRPTAGADLAAAVVASPAYADQRSRAARMPITDEQVTALLRRLVAAPSHRVDRESAAAALGVPVMRLAGALPLVQRLLNVEQYPVLSQDPDGRTVVLDLSLLQEQFGASP